MNKHLAGVFVGLAFTAGPVFSQNKWDISKVNVSKLPAASKQKGVTYEKDIKPILEASCFGCHGGERPKGDLSLDSRETVLKGGKHGKVVTTGKSAKSVLVVAASQIDERTAMPPKGGGGSGGEGRGGPGGPGGRGGAGRFGPGMMLAPQIMTQADKNKDKKLSKPELTGLGDTWFVKLDPKKVGKVTQEEFTARLGSILPGQQGKGAGGGGPAGKGGGFQPGRMLGPGLFQATDS